MRLALKLVRADLRSSRGRVVAVLLMVALATALLMASRVLAASTESALDDATAVPYSTADILIRSTVTGGGSQSGDGLSGATGALDESAVETMRDIPGVAGVATHTRARAAAQVGDVTRGIALESVPNSGSFAWQRLLTGRAPQGGAEVALTEATTDALGIGVGDRVALGHPGVGRAVFRVVGEVDVRGAVEYSGAYGIVREDVARSLAGVSGPNVAMVRLLPGADPADVIDQINETSPGGFAQTTADLIAAGAAAEQSRAAGVATAISGFAALALVVAAVVLATTTAVSIGSRRRAVALLRGVGATRAQVARQAVAEVAVLGLAGVVAGIVLGILAGGAVLPLVGLVPGLPDVPVSAFTVRAGDVALTFLIATGLASLAAAAPTATAARVSPAEALSRDGAAVRHAGLIAWSVAAAACLVGGSFLLRADAVGQVGAGAVLLTTGACAALAPLLRVIASGVRVRARSAPLRLAAGDLVRAPRRAAAEAVALTVSAALVAATWVGVASAGATLSQRLDTTTAPDLTVGAAAGSGVVEDETLDDLAGVDGVATTLPLAFGVDVALRGRDGDKRVRIAVGTAQATAADLDRVLPGGAPVAELSDDTVYLPSAAAPPFPADGTVTLQGSDGEVGGLAVRYVDDLQVPSLVTPALMDQVSDRTEVRAVWLDLADGASGADRGATIEEVVGAAVVAGQLPVTGPAVLDEQAALAMRSALATATALLAVAVLVALVGAATTSALSVREQWREHAVMRALGLERGSLRRLITLRLSAISLTAGVLGAGAGAVVGASATRVVATSLGLEPVYEWPWLPIVLLVAVVALLAHLATTGPAEKAAFVRPARALTEG